MIMTLPFTYWINLIILHELGITSQCHGMPENGSITISLRLFKWYQGDCRDGLDERGDFFSHQHWESAMMVFDVFNNQIMEFADVIGFLDGSLVR